MNGLSQAQRIYDRDISERTVVFHRESEYQAPEVAPLKAGVIRSHKFVELPNLKGDQTWQK